MSGFRVRPDEILAQAAPMPRVPLWLIALFTFSGTLAMHIFVPALPAAARDLQASNSAMQLTVSLYILGLAFGQLVYGPVSDRFGRRPVLIAGLLLYTAAGLGALLAAHVETLIVARLFQAFGGCAGLVLGRAIVRDTGGTTDSARRLAVLNLFVTVGPAVAPVIGGLMAADFGWHSVLLLLCLLGVLNCVLAWRLLPETRLAGTGNNAAAVARDYRRLIVSPAFLGFALGGGCATTAMYAFIASAPFIFVNELGRPPYEVGVYLAVLVSGVWLGSAIASRLLGRYPISRLLVAANLLSVAAAFVLLATVLLGRLDAALAVGCMFTFTLGAGISSPAALTQAISVNPRVVGSASGLYGFAQMAVGAVCTALAGIGRDPALSTAIVLAGAGIVAQLSFWLALRQPGRGA